MINRAVHTLCQGAPRAHDSKIVRRVGWYQVVTPSRPGAEFNRVWHSVLSEKEVDWATNRAAGDFAAIGSRFAWMTNPLTLPGDLGSHLEGRGFEARPFSVVGGKPAALKLKARGAVVVERVDAGSADALLDLVDSEPGGPARDHVAEALEQDTRQFYLASVDGTPAGWAGLTRLKDTALLAGGGVRDRFRGKGAYRALMAARLDDLRSASVSAVFAVAEKPDAAPILGKFGFETVYEGVSYLSPE